MLLLLVVLILSTEAQILNWASLDDTSDDIRGMGRKYQSVSGINDTLLNPNPNSTQSINNRISLTYQDEENMWSGDTQGALTVVSTWTYLKAMGTMSSVIGNFIRTAYTSIFEDLPLETCNAIVTPPEVIQDSNLGFAPNNILLGSNDLSLLIPPHTCVLPQLSTYPNGPVFDTLRKFMPIYKTYLLQLDGYFECILLYNAFPSYTKGVNCLEEYYYGSQDAGANPPFFDLMANKKDLQNSIQNFNAIPVPNDVMQINLTSWTDYQYALDIARQYKNIARKVRSVSMLLYTAMTRNYARLARVKTCRSLEAQIYANAQNVTDFWCHYQNCFASNFSFALIGQQTGSPLEPQNQTICQNNTCPITATFPDPFYCDVNRQCPDSWYCSLINRHCYKTNARQDFNRVFNLTICGYPRRLADASVITGQVNSAFGGSVSESSFWFNTFWPQNCTTTTARVPDPSHHLDIGPNTFSQVCYPFDSGANPNAFYVGGTTNCSLLNQTTIVFINVLYLFYVDGIATGFVNANIPVLRSSTGSQPWQIEHCKSNGEAPWWSPDMACNSTDTTCITQNSTHVCYHNVQDILRVSDHLLTVSVITCENERLYGNANNATYNYTDPNANSFPPAPQGIPTGYTNSTYFNMTASQYGSLSGTYTSTGGTVPISLGSGYAEFVGYYNIQSIGNYKLCGRLSFHPSPGTPMYTEGKDYFLSTHDDLSMFYLPTLAVDNSTGVKLYNPLVDNHPNPRFNDPNECFFLQVSADANIPMIASPAPGPEEFKHFWTDGVTLQNPGNNVVPVLYPCAAIFLRKILYVQNQAWLNSPATDYEAGLQSGDLRYVCARSLIMPATCSRFGSPMSSSDLNAVLASVNPPSDVIVFQL